MDKHDSNRNGEPLKKPEDGIVPGAAGSANPLGDKFAAGPPPTLPAQPHTAATLAEDVPPDEPVFMSRAWWVQNGPTLAIVAALLIFAIMKLQFWGVVKAAVGLSFVVFIHELGHFLAAKWCNVNVTTFSIGFGPTIPGCWYRRGETTYRLGLIPVGGYVQMVGQVDGDESTDDGDDPRSYRRKTVGQRMLIISAGVIMNVILAIVCFIIVFRGPGKDRKAGVIGSIDTGFPAFKAGLKPGAEILQLGDRTKPYFDRLLIRVMGSSDGDRITFVTQVPGEDKTEVDIEPRFDKGQGKFMVGVGFPLRSELTDSGKVPESWKGPVVPNSVAAKAEPPFEFEDVIVATTDPVQGEKYDPYKTLDLPDDPRLRKDPVYKKQPDYFVLRQRLLMLAGKPMVLVVERTKDKTKKRVDISVSPTSYLSLGGRMQMGHVTAIRDNSPAVDKVLLARKNPEGNPIKADIIQMVEVKEPDGKITRYEDKTLDPERLPFQLRQWSDRMAAAKAAQPWKVKLRVKRYLGFTEGDHQDRPEHLELDWKHAWRYVEMSRGDDSSPCAIPELGLAYRIKNVVADASATLNPDSALQPEDLIEEVKFIFEGDSHTIKLKEEDESWAYVAEFLQLNGPLIKEVVLKRAKEPKEVKVTPHAVADWHTPANGFRFALDQRRQRAESMTEAIGMGFADTWDNMVQVYQNLRGMIRGDISATKNLGGPVTIARVAYFLANMDFWEFLFFLGLISVNLAVINFLPIPVLDGGHMVFLIYEKLRGKPASEGVRIGATYAGLAIILCLMVFVLYLDIGRLFTKS